MNTERHDEIRKALHALDTRRGNLLDKLQDPQFDAFPWQEKIRALRAEQEHVTRRIAPTSLVPDDMLTDLGKAVDSLDANTNELVSSLDDLNAQVTQLATEVRVLGEERKRLASLIAPIRLLPDELLAEIWNYVRAPELHPDYEGIPFPYFASWVSSRWRSVAIGTAGLWRDIYISPYRSVALIKVQLERSKACSLNIWVTGDNYRDHIAGSIERTDRERKMGDLVVAAAACVGRWYSLKVKPSGAAYLSNILPPLRNAYAPQLKHLSITFPIHPYLEPLFAGGTPNLRYIDFHNMSILSNLTLFRGLTQLDLSNIPSDGLPSQGEFQGVLASCPLLAALALSGRCFGFAPIADHRSPICLHSLVSFRFRFAEPEEDLTSALFNIFSAPGLEHLALVDVGFEACYAFMDAMRTSPPSSRYPILRKLSLYAAEEDPSWNAPRLLGLFPHVTDLDLVCGGDDLSSMLIALSLPSSILTLYTPGLVLGADAICPRLKTLTCPVWSVCDEAKMQDVVTARSEMGFPITSRRVDSDYFMHATQAMLSANVNVESMDD